jgi:predicted RNase H-like HicB family nuclease
VNVVTTGETREQAIYRLKEILAAEILISNPKLSVESAFEQLIMCNKLGI